MKRVVAVVLMLFAVQAQAGLFSDDEARQQIIDLRNALQPQIKKLEDRQTQQEAASKRTLELLNQIEKLREEIAALRGKNEVLQFNQEEAAKRQRDLYVDLDARLRSIETKIQDYETRLRGLEAKEQGREVAAKEQARLEQLAEQQKQLDSAIAQIKSGKNKDGVAALNKFLAEHPQTTLQPEAMYWSGVANSSLKDYKTANAAFSEVVNKSADHPRAPDALLGLASIAAARKDAKASRKFLSVIMEKYPQSEAAVTAKKALAVN